ncbi:Na+/H+ antiporter subunit E [Gelria sp. Kuro-4]|uniref:Na+/H+ antiporter subunit E n=1 Tax=Gelria sp. Kuro-4 TaxID=2796927 RepID=UPI001C7FE4AA|nr:Na+/H+ antiporter subunit E [Gelria sp. Kuro-4]
MPIYTYAGGGRPMPLLAELLRLVPRIKAQLAWAASLFAFWLALAWAADSQHLVAGVVCVFFLAILWRELVPRHSFPLRAFPALILYLALLAGEILQAGVHVAAIVLNPRLPIAPAFRKVKVPLSTPGGKTALANSITLTPGTLTVEVEDQAFLVHMIDRNVPFNLPEWTLTKLLAELERGGEP